MEKQSARTRNRLREHKDLRPKTVVHGTHIANIPGLLNTRSILVECFDQDCDWYGWLPLNELPDDQRKKLTDRVAELLKGVNND